MRTSSQMIPSSIQLKELPDSMLHNVGPALSWNSVCACPCVCVRVRARGVSVSRVCVCVCQAHAAGKPWIPALEAALWGTKIR